MSLKPFKFFQKEERVFTQWMDEMDDYHLGGIRSFYGISGQRAVRFVHQFNQSPADNRAYEIIIEDTVYKIIETRFDGGELSTIKVAVYPSYDETIRITYWINVGRAYPFITNYTVDNL
jgi:hypothetical protein